MFLIATKFVLLLASAYFFGLLVAWLFSFFNDNDGGDDGGNNNPNTPQPTPPGKIAQPNNQKRLVEVDESYYLEEFDLSKK